MLNQYINQKKRPIIQNPRQDKPYGSFGSSGQSQQPQTTAAQTQPEGMYQKFLKYTQGQQPTVPIGQRRQDGLYGSFGPSGQSQQVQTTTAQTQPEGIYQKFLERTQAQTPTMPIGQTQRDGLYRGGQSNQLSFETMARESGLYDSFSPYDLELAKKYPEFGFSILSLKQQYAKAKTPEERARINQQANDLRSSYGGYTGGGDGSQYIANGLSPSSYQSPYQSAIDALLGQLGNYGNFSYDTPAPTYNNRYQTTIDDLLNQIVNRPEFSYDHTSDPVWSAYKKQYTREGDRASATALAQASAASGGIPSSYAQTAASQAGDYYAAQLSDMIPTLYQQAYDRYLNDNQMTQNALAAVSGQEQNDYQKYLTNLGQWNTDRDFAYTDYLNGFNMLGSALSAYQGQDSTQYQRLLDQIDHNNTQEQMKNSAKQQEINNAMSLWTQLGYADQTVADALGVPVGTPTSDQRYTEWNMKRTDSQDTIGNAMDRWTQLGYADQAVADALGVPVGTKTSDQSYTEWNMKRTEQQDAQSAQQQAVNNAMDRWTQLGYADQAVADVLGVPVGTKTSDQKYREWNMRKSASGSGGSSGSGGYGGYDTNMDPYELLYAEALTSENPKNYLSSHYKEFGISSSAGLWEGYKNWQATGDKTAENITTENLANMRNYVKKLYDAMNKDGKSTEEKDSAERTKEALEYMGWKGSLIDLIFSQIGL